MRTYQTRLASQADAAGALDAYGARFSRALRTLHARRRAGRPVSKPGFMGEFDLTARQFNAVRLSLDGIERSYRERLPELIAQDEARLLSVGRRLAKADDDRTRHQLQRRMICLAHRIDSRREDVQKNAVRICFGSRRLFGAQHHLAENGYDSLQAWKNAWEQARSRQFFVLGSKDETGGCQGCVAEHLGEGRFSFRLRLPNGLGKKYVAFEARFAYGWEHLVWALDHHQAISYRFLRDERGWRLFASTAVAPIDVTSDLRAGAIGVDLNADHVAVSRTDRFGNVLETIRMPLVTYGASREQRTARIGDVVAAIVALAGHHAVPIVIERLDFARKKTRLREHGARYARMLSSFAYRRFDQMLRARAHDAGVAVIGVNPAYSSVIGKAKFAKRYGLSSHQSAALVLARRAQGCSERLNRHDRVALGSSARKNARHVWSHWVALVRQTAGSASRRRSSQRGDPVSAAAESATTLPSAGGIPARESVASTVRAAS